MGVGVNLELGRGSVLFRLWASIFIKDPILQYPEIYNPIINTSNAINPFSFPPFFSSFFSPSFFRCMCVCVYEWKLNQ